jgi:hypothetical protein
MNSFKSNWKLLFGYGLKPKTGRRFQKLMITQQKQFRCVDFCKIVYFDLETSGFGKYILPTAPKLEENPLISI